MYIVKNKYYCILILRVILSTHIIKMYYTFAYILFDKEFEQK